MQEGYSSVENQSSFLRYDLDSQRTLSGITGTEFGVGFALTPDGSKVVIGARYVNDAGEFYVYTDDGTAWTPEPGKAGKSNSNERFAMYLDISSDGNTISTGAHRADSNGLKSNGAAFVWSYDGTSWVKVGSSVKGSRDNAYLGQSTRISDNGTRFITGGTGHLGSKGAAQVFSFNSLLNDWDPVGSAIRGGQSDDGLASRVEISGDGSTVAISSDGNRKYIWVMYFDVAVSDWVLKGVQFDLPSASYETESLWLNYDGSKFAYGAYDDASGATAGFVRVLNWDEASKLWVQMGSDVIGDNLYSQFGKG